VLSTGGVAVSKHLCDGEIKDIAFFHAADPCEHSASATSIQCPIHEDMVIFFEIETDDCCTDTTELVRDEHPQIVTKSLDIPDFQLGILYTFIYSKMSVLESTDSKFNSPFLHLPPLINQDINILVQSFLL
jgi:hypothetical protein